MIAMGNITDYDITDITDIPRPMDRRQKSTSRLQVRTFVISFNILQCLIQFTLHTYTNTNWTVGTGDANLLVNTHLLDKNAIFNVPPSTFSTFSTNYITDFVIKSQNIFFYLHNKRNPKLEHFLTTKQTLLTIQTMIWCICLSFCASMHLTWLFEL